MDAISWRGEVSHGLAVVFVDNSEDQGSAKHNCGDGDADCYAEKAGDQRSKSTGDCDDKNGSAACLAHDRAVALVGLLYVQFLQQLFVTQDLQETATVNDVPNFQTGEKSQEKAGEIVVLNAFGEQHQPDKQGH